MPNATSPRPDGKDHVAEEVEAWAENRAAYPGWVVAPAQTRERISSHTIHWIRPLLASLPQRLPLDALRLLDELNWRLELALLPMYDDVAVAVERVLSSVHPFHGLPVAPDAPPPFKLAGSEIPPAQWGAHRGRWLALGLGLLRYYREERRHDRFDELSSRLRPCLDNTALLSRWCYERCLWSFSRLDDPAARQALEQWPAEAEDPAWEVRRAGVLAELGEVSEALRTAEDALRRIRASSGPAHIPAASREGWAMLLSQMVERAICIARRVPLPDYWGRFAELERVRCDPWVEIQRLQERLTGPPPRPKPQLQDPPAFTIAHLFAAYSSQRIWDELPPAYQYQRLCEDGPFPPQIGNLRGSAETLRRISEWLSDIDPPRPQSAVCRALDTKAASAYLTPHRVATLSAAAVNDLVECGVRGLREPPPVTAGSDSGPDTPTIRERAVGRLELSSVLLSCLAGRLSHEQAAGLLPLAIRLSESEAARGSFSLPEMVGALLRSVLASMSPADLGSNLLQLVRLPVAGTAELSVAYLQRWPDLVDVLPERIASPSRGTAAEAWASRIAELISLLRSAPEGRRGPVAMLLRRLMDLGLLTQEEQAQFADALWGVGVPFQAPSVQPFALAVLLRLPEPSPGTAASAVLAALNAGDLPRFRVRSVSDDGKESVQHPMYTQPDRMLLEWLAASPERQRAPGVRGVEPSLAERTALLGKLRSWWEEEGRALVTADYSGSPGMAALAVGPRTRCVHTLEVIKDVVLSNSQRGREWRGLAADALALADEIQRAGVPVCSFYPASLRFRPEGRDTAEALIASGLVSSSEAEYRDAVHGLVFWLRTQGPRGRRPRGYPLPPPPDHLLRQLGINVATRRRPGLRVSLDAAAEILSSLPGLASDDFRSSVALGLRYLLVEAAYRPRGDAGEPIPYSDVPNIRFACVRLARTAARRGVDDPSVQRWLAEAANDPLNVIRTAGLDEEDGH